MATKTITTRIKNRFDALSEWNKTGVSLLPGEIALVKVTTQTIDDNGRIVDVPAVLMKVGESDGNGGTKAFSDLPWLSAKAADVYDWAKEQYAKDIPVTVFVGTTETNGTLGGWLKEINDRSNANAANHSDLSAKVDVDKVSTAISTAVNTAINSLNSTDSGSGSFVKAVTQANGKVTVTYGSILADDIPTLAATKIEVTSGTNLSQKLGSIDSDIADLKAKREGHTDDAINTLIINKINTLDSVSDGTTGSFVTNVTQTDGKVTVSKGNLPAASASAAGIVKLGATGGAATYDAVDSLTTQVNTNKSDIADLKNAVAGGVHFIGTVSAEPTSTTKTVNGHTVIVGDVVIYDGKEYICAAITSGAPSWEQLGDVTRIGNLETKLNNLDVTDTNVVATTHKFVSQVTQTDGKIAVTYTQPTAADVSYDSGTVATKLAAVDAALAEKAVANTVYTKDQTDSAISTAINNLDFTAPTATDNSNNPITFIDSVSQTDGKISATKKTIRAATTSVSGIVQLSDATNSDVSTTAATSKAVKAAYDKADAAAADAASRATGTHGHGNITNDGKLGTANAVVVTDANKNVIASTTITTTELGYLDGVTSNIQTQLNSKAASEHGTHVTYGGNGSAATVSRSDHSHTAHEARTTNIEGNYVRFANDKLYVGKDGVDEIIFDCGGAILS